MTFTSFALVAGLVLCSSAALWAADQNVQPKPAKTAKLDTAKAPASGRSTQKETTTLTGSHLKQNTRREGLIAVGPNVVYIVDSDSIRNSGATDISQLLTRRGFRR